MRENIIQIIEKCARIPSFSSYEESHHPIIKFYADQVFDASFQNIPENNVFIAVPGRKKVPPVALTAHLDKINHFGKEPPTSLPFKVADEFIEGQLDDSVGVGLCLSILMKSQDHLFPPLLFLFSEVEESFGLKKHPQLLRNEGKGIQHGMGAERLSHFLIMNKLIPSLCLTIDTTPLFHGERGIAIYSNHWELNGLQATEELVHKTSQITEQFININSDLYLSNNTNDYLVYGLKLNEHTQLPVPSLAIEPAIYPYHQIGEKVFIDDIERTEQLLITFLEQYEG